MSIPDWYELALLGLASWRSFQFAAFDEILDRPRRWLLRLDEGENYRLSLDRFITCSYCAGAWIAIIWWGAWQITERWTTIIASLVALTVAPIIGHQLLSRPEDR